MDLAKRLLNLERSVLPEDHFNYQMKRNNVIAVTRYAFLWQVVKFLDQASKERNNINDIARLCHLVKDIGTSRQRSSQLGETIDKILYRLRFMNTRPNGRESMSKDLRRNNVMVKGTNKSTPRLRSPARRRKTTTNVARKINGAM